MTYLSRCTILSRAAVLIILVSPFAMANTVLDELAICTKTIDSLQRLVCYDKLAEKTKISLPSAHHLQHPATKKIQSEPLSVQSELLNRSPVVQPLPTVDLADTAKQQQAKFGQENKKRTEDVINQIQATIIKINKAIRGQLIITLDNGQVWRQTDSTRFNLSKGQTVIIKRGAMGSFFIGKENVNKRIRAKRVD